ncbi:MAG: PA14 domain-containing protein [Patescibacteria group bacterium]|nr:PA14 domain-containing protein [Patescibacteria group bacterium]
MTNLTPWRKAGNKTSRLRHLTLSRKLALGTALLAMAVGLMSPSANWTASVKNENLKLNKAQAAAAALSLSNTRSIDVMKYTKDVMANQPSDAQIANLVATLKSLNVNYIALSIPMDPTADYPAGSKPAPRTAESFTQAWADAVHNAGLHVLWRGAFSGMEGIYNFPHLVGSNRIPAGTAASAATDGSSTWLGKTYQYIVKNPSFFQNGDIWAPMPERTEGIFSDGTSWISSAGAGLQANYVNFFNDLKTVSEQAFSQIGKSGVYTGLTTNNYSEVMSTWLPQAFFNNAGYTVIDYYGNNHTPQEMDSDLRAMASRTGKPVFLQEWGDYWNQNMSQTDRTNYLNQIYSVLQNLASQGILAGFNYWGGWANNAEGILNQSGDNFSLNYRGQLLADFFGKYGGNGSVTPPPSDNNGSSGGSTNGSTPPPSTISCPAPATNAFTGCYYSDQNLNNLALSRTDNSINFDWGGGSPDSKVPSDHFSARWQGNFSFNGGDYTFTATADDGIKVYVDNNLIINQWKDQPASTYAANLSLAPGSHLVKVEYYENAGGALAKVSWQQNNNNPPSGNGLPDGSSGSTTPPANTSSCPSPANNAFTGCYYSGANFNNLVLSRTDNNINFAWNNGSPDPKVPADQFSARWEGNFTFNAGDYSFNMTSDDGSKLYIDNQLAIDQWSDHAAQTKTITKTLTAGIHNIKMEYYEAYGGAVAKLNWNQVGSGGGLTGNSSGGSSGESAGSNGSTGGTAQTGGFAASYYAGTNFQRLLLTKADPTINFAWNNGSPDPSVPSDQFSARWTGDFNFTAGNHAFNITSDDGARLYVDGQLVISDWNDHASKTDTKTIYLSAGTHNIKMEYYEAYGGAVAKLNWN